MSVFCWIPGDNLNYSSYNGNFNLSKSQKTVLAYTNTADTEDKPFVTSKNLSIFKNSDSKFTIKTIARSVKGEIVPIAAACDVQPTAVATDEEQAKAITKAIYVYAKKMNLTIEAPHMQQSVRSAMKFFRFDLFDIHHILMSLAHFDAPSLAQYLDNIDTYDATRLRGYLKMMGASGNGTISVISAAAQRSLYQSAFVIDIISNIGAGFAIAKLVAAIIKWINAKREIASFDRADNQAKNAKRIAYAQEMVGYLNNLQKNQTPLPANVQKDLIAFFSSDENDGKELYQMTENLSKIAQNRGFMDKLKGSLGIN